MTEEEIFALIDVVVEKLQEASGGNIPDNWKKYFKKCSAQKRGRKPDHERNVAILAELCLVRQRGSVTGLARKYGVTRQHIYNLNDRFKHDTELKENVQLWIDRHRTW